MAYPYWKISKRVDKQLDRGPFAGTYSFYAAPEIISPGDPVRLDQLTASLKRCGYKESFQQPLEAGNYQSTGSQLLIHPFSNASYPAHLRIDVNKDAIAKIADASGKQPLPQFDLGPVDDSIGNPSTDSARWRKSVRGRFAAYFYVTCRGVEATWTLVPRWVSGIGRQA